LSIPCAIPAPRSGVRPHYVLVIPIVTTRHSGHGRN